MVERKDPALVKETIAAGGDVNQQVSWTSPLTTAASLDSLEMLDLLIKSGADVHRNPDPDSRSVMHAALMKGHIKIARRLIEAGVRPDIFSHCGLGMLNEVKQELDRNPSSGLRYDVAGNIPLSYAVAGQQTAVVELLFKRGMTAEAGGHHYPSPVELAAKLDSPDILRLLMQHRVSPESGRGDAAFNALDSGKLESFKLLLDAKANLQSTRRGETLLHRAARLDLPVEFAEELLNHGADVHVLTKGYSDDGCGPSDPKSTQETPLHLAARTLKPEHVKLFLSRGAKPDLKDQAGLTPLAAAIAQCIEASVRERDTKKEGRTVSTGLATIEALIAGGCSTDATDSNGAIIRDTIAELLKHPERATQQNTADTDNPFLPGFILRPTQYRGPTGFDARLVPVCPELEKLLQLLAKS